MAVWWLVFLQIFAAGQRLITSTAIRIKGDDFRYLYFGFPVNKN